MLGAIYLVTLASGGVLALLIPAVFIALAGGDFALAEDMALVTAFGACICTMVLASLSQRIGPIERELNFVSLVLVWLVTPITAALCLMALVGLGPMQAWFEGVSALTTAVATVLQRQTVPTALLFWRSALEWYGGFLILVSIIHVLAPAGFGGLKASGRRRGTGGKADGHWGAIAAYSSIFWQYGALTIAIALLLIIARVDPANAVMLAMMSISTGGFLPFEGTLDEHIGLGAIFVLAIGLCFGTLSVFWRRNILRNPRRVLAENREARIVILAILGLGIVYAARISEASGSFSAAGVLTALVEGFFTASSLIATSGAESRPGVFALLPSFLVLCFVFVGASVYSTSGGIKVYRLATMWIFAKAELNRLIYPSAVAPSKFGRDQIDDDAIRAVWSYFVLALLCVATGTVLITATAANFEGGLAMAVTFFAGASPAYESLIPIEAQGSQAISEAWPAFEALPTTALLPAIVLMTIGRLEVLIVFAVINIKYWLQR
jgi:trk system potassium uptake protein